VRVKNPAVAVLTDSLTTSSGEGMLVAFRGRPSTRSFGAATFGVPTVLRGFKLADAATLVVTTLLFRDRNGRSYDAPIAPDEPVAQNGAPATDDATVAAATAWLAAQPSCSGQ
jgi:C-terminal processing protease CtpA/Prc